MERYINQNAHNYFIMGTIENIKLLFIKENWRYSILLWWLIGGIGFMRFLPIVGIFIFFPLLAFLVFLLFFSMVSKKKYWRISHLSSNHFIFYISSLSFFNFYLFSDSRLNCRAYLYLFIIVVYYILVLYYGISNWYEIEDSALSQILERIRINWRIYHFFNLVGYIHHRLHYIYRILKTWYSYFY